MDNMSRRLSLCAWGDSRVTLGLRSARRYRLRHYEDVFVSSEAVTALVRPWPMNGGTESPICRDEVAAVQLLESMMQLKFIERVSKKTDEFTGLSKRHATTFKVSPHTSRKPSCFFTFDNEKTRRFFSFRTPRGN